LIQVFYNTVVLVTAYQEGLVTLAQLRLRMPALQKQTQAVESELQSLQMAAVDQAKYLKLAESLAGFRSKLRVRAEALDIAVRQQILRLLVKEVLVGSDTITLRHSIPIPQSGPRSNGSPSPVFRRWREPAETRLSFAFGESSPRLEERLFSRSLAESS
jgi:site-specific DNA recombinase